MGGSIYYKDGRKQSIWNLRYEYVYLKVEFEPPPKTRKRAWSIW